MCAHVCMHATITTCMNAHELFMYVVYRMTFFVIGSKNLTNIPCTRLLHKYKFCKILKCSHLYKIDLKGTFSWNRTFLKGAQSWKS